MLANCFCEGDVFSDAHALLHLRRLHPQQRRNSWNLFATDANDFCHPDAAAFPASGVVAGGEPGLATKAFAGLELTAIGCFVSVYDNITIGSSGSISTHGADQRSHLEELRLIDPSHICE
ncbi:unnamed protein product [Heligmosomoides polygyrus]|uniref:C2H2-type domain-containing protein n=1 Tax=Heligmosomoides polygyrus TaxID=6339 RepID=A0A183GI16_HELPZ|nr:unnamed protein product [Heligmosomoides polygyrus]